MSLSLDEVKKIARLARIAITEDEVVKYQGELNRIFTWIEQLQEVNTENVEPMYSTVDHDLPQREDVVNDGNIKEDVLCNAPISKFGYYVVTKVVE